MDFLFEPDRVERRLRLLPFIAGQLPPPSAEGVPATPDPPGMRKSPREIYRLLGNAEMPHLRPALLAVENCIASGVALPELFSSQRHEQFSSHLTEAIAADHFLLKGFAVTKIPRRNTRTADFVVRDGHLDATVEIYSPREWEALADWETALWDLVKNLDVPQVFRAGVNTTAPHGTDPWSIARALSHTGAGVLDAIEADLLQHFVSNSAKFQKTYNHASHNITTTVEVEVLAARGHYRGRFIFRGSPTITGHAPEGMFNRVVNHKLRKKARHGQAQAGSARLHGVLVDLQRSAIADDLRTEPYRTLAQQSAATVDLNALGLDFVAFCGRAFLRRNRPRRGLFTDNIIFEDTRMSQAEVEHLLWPV
jgi:hypothetical protein